MMNGKNDFLKYQLFPLEVTHFLFQINLVYMK